MSFGANAIPHSLGNAPDVFERLRIFTYQEDRSPGSRWYCFSADRFMDSSSSPLFRRSASPSRRDLSFAADGPVISPYRLWRLRRQKPKGPLIVQLFV